MILYILSTTRIPRMSLEVEQGEKRPVREKNGAAGPSRLQESINRLPAKDQSLNEMYDPPGSK